MEYNNEIKLEEIEKFVNGENNEELRNITNLINPIDFNHNFLQNFSNFIPNVQKTIDNQDKSNENLELGNF